MRILFAVFPLLLLSGCTSHATVTPEGDRLDAAVVGIPYFDQIHIHGGRAYTLDKHTSRPKFVGTISPDDMGLSVSPCNEYAPGSSNCAVVKGVPVRPGVVKVRVAGSLFGTNISTGGSFSKTYTITVRGYINDMP